MTEQQTQFVKVDVNDLVVGTALRFPLYDSSGRLLLKRGHVVESVDECEQLIGRGLYRSLTERSSPSTPPPVAAEAPPSRETLVALHATKIRIGDTLQMQGSADAPRLTVKLIGYLRNRGLIVTEPEAAGDFVMLKEGQPFVIRFFSGKSAYAFASTVTKSTSVPFPHVCLSYPREVRGLVIRNDSRVDVDLIAAVGVDGEGEAQAGSGKIVNLSTGGAALRSKARLGHKGDVINVKFKLLIGDLQTYVAFDSVIRMVDKDQLDPTMPYLHGIQFVEPEQSMKLAVAAYVYQKLGGQST